MVSEADCKSQVLSPTVSSRRIEGDAAALVLTLVDSNDTTAERNPVVMGTLALTTCGAPDASRTKNNTSLAVAARMSAATVESIRRVATNTPNGVPPGKATGTPDA